jgi:hypothetical protein
MEGNVNIPSMTCPAVNITPSLDLLSVLGPFPLS